MFKQVAFHGSLNNRTGYGNHATNFTRALSKLIPVNVEGEGDIHISLLDVVTASQITTFPPSPSILMTVWESTCYPDAFIDNLKHYDQLWLVSNWEKSCAVAQGIKEEFIRVIPEGVDPEIFYPLQVIDPPETFNFLVVGQWQPRKSTKEICESFLRAFPRNNRVRLYLSVDTLYPCDEFKSTEERLAGNGIFDERIIPVHFETREAYVRRLQTCNCYVQCSRAEGWGLPGIEAMACGAVSILENWGGSTEYSEGALLVNVPELEKPEGIYGGWDVPGEWGSPDYDHFVTLMKDAYKNYDAHKEKAFVTANKIRTNFSWEAAAKKAYTVLEELSQKTEQILIPVDVEKDILAYARRQGYDIMEMKKRSVIFIVDSHPDSQEKLDCLIETIQQIKGFGYPVCLSTHLPAPKEVIDLCDFYVYDKRDILSIGDPPIYWRRGADGKEEEYKSTIPCHALASLHNVRNSIDICKDKYDWIYQMSSDAEVDLGEWLEKVHASDKPLIGTHWGGDKETLGGQLLAGKSNLMDKYYTPLKTWAEFAALMGQDRFCSERGWYRIAVEKFGLENIEFIDIEIGNRFDQVDKNAWGGDKFECHFIDGPFLNIIGIGGVEYDVEYSNPIDGVQYTLKQKPNMWSRASKKYFRDWTIKAFLKGELKLEHHLDLKDKNVIVSMGSKALGDTIAWIPYVEEFRKKHGCNVYCSTWWNTIMDYPEIHFVAPGDKIDGVYATYTIGCFDDQLDLNVENWRTTPLQKVASDILGLDYKPLKARLKYRENEKKPKPYICFSEFSTMQNKLWNRPGAWQKIIDYLDNLGYDCISISAEPTQLNGVIKHNGQSIEQTLTDLSGSEFYIGLNHGPAWLAYALNKPVIMITGVSEPFNDFPMFARIQTDECRPGCFNDPSLPIDRGWTWCPRGKDFICTRSIKESKVKMQIDILREELSCQSQSKRKVASIKSAHPTAFTQKEQPSKKPKAKKSFLTQSSMVGDRPEALE